MSFLALKKRAKLLNWTVAIATLGAAAPALAERGEDGELRIMFWQAPSVLNPYISNGYKDIEPAGLVVEPLVRFDPDGNMVPWLVTEIPSLENGGVSEDLTQMTWHLKPNITWSDGTPFTSEDVKFTYEYCTSPEFGCAYVSKFASIESVETPDDQTVVINFDVAKSFPYSAFVGSFTPVLQKKQFADCMGTDAVTCSEQNFMPIGTGPFVVEEFRPNDIAVFSANENYREPDKPHFAKVVLKGGGDAAAAARAVLQTGEFDYAWNLQVAPDVLNSMLEGSDGKLITGFGNNVERIYTNLTDPSAELGEERSTPAHPHPFLSDIRVRQALSIAIDRQLLTDTGYGNSGRPTCNLLPAPAIYRSSQNDGCLEQDIEGAKALLEEAGYIDSDGDGIRDKDGVRLKILFQTSNNAVRQDTQALIKHWWSQIGVETELRNIDGSVFFGADPGSPDNLWKFYADVQMYMDGSSGTDPEAYMAYPVCDEIPGPDSQWQGNNIARFCSPEYDALVEKMAQTGELNKRAELAKKMNDILIQSYVIIPLIERGRLSGVSGDLDGVQINAWDNELWNIADWSRAE
ncbi:peptide ABC transporter substrate-binding protein [Rhodobacteraceae bacterium F11138]|nr:peptide ABC transporter substrate-binding protein [Rhodobacteraceae bacterium F11138]